MTKGMIRGRKLLSISGWPKHGVLWEVTDLPPGDFNVEARFLEADRDDEWNGHVLVSPLTFQNLIVAEESGQSKNVDAKVSQR